VTRNGVPVGAGNGHTFFRVTDPLDIDRVRIAIRLHAIGAGMAWLKPKFSRTNGAVVGQADATILDLSTLLPGRLVFDGAPTAGKGLDVGEPVISVHQGSARAIDTTWVAMPSRSEVRELCRPLGLNLQLSGDGHSLKVDSFDLRLDTLLETEDFGLVSLAQTMLCPSAMRCQAPFRASESMAAKLNFDSSGRPFVHDVGTGTNHWLRDEDWLPIRDADVVREMPGAEDVAAQVAAAEKADEVIAKAMAARFEPSPWHAFTQGQPPSWLVRGVLPQAELAVIYGESGSGKTFFALDLVAAVARGVEWRGRRVKAGRVVYVCAEGGGGFRKRIRAYAHTHGVSAGAMQLEVISERPDLLSNDHKALATAIGKASIVVVDTLAQTTPGANENSGEDMGKALSHCRDINRATGALVLLIHHSGKDAARGARGWSGLKGACDAEIEVSRVHEARAARISKQKDGEEGEVLPFKLQPVLLGQDEDGEITSCVVAVSEAAPIARGPAGSIQAAVFGVAQELVKTTERVPREALVQQAIARLPEPPEDKEDRRRDKVKRALDTLIADNFLVEDADGIGTF
jgi:AAA domain